MITYGGWTNFIVQGRVLANQERPCSKDTGGSSKDVEMDVWTY